MSIAIKEASIHDALPIELYEFLGSYKNYYLTTCSEPVTFQGNIYYPLEGMTRNNIKAGTNTEDNIIAKVTMTVDTAIVADYGFQITPPRLMLNVYRIHRDLVPYESFFQLYWRGPVTNINIKGTSAIFDVPSIFSNVLGASCPTVYYQTPCNHVLYDVETCKVPRSANSVDTAILHVQPNRQVLTLASFGTFAPTDFVGGEIYIASQNERRMVIGADLLTDEITVNYPFGRASDGLSVQVTRGCDHAWKGDCLNRFGNTINFGGHPLIPALNLFETGF